MKTYTPDQLRDFETRVAEEFNRGNIRAPVHLSDGSEEALIEIFSEVGDRDYVYCSWRSHYQCLLKGVPPEYLFDQIMAGKSISLNFPEYRIFSTAIVTGQLPIATGTALAISRAGLPEKVWCFLGDMTAETGMAQTCMRYAANHNLPITFVVEDNGVSVCTETRQVWGTPVPVWETHKYPNVRSFSYKSSYPHAGAGVRVQF